MDHDNLKAVGESMTDKENKLPPWAAVRSVRQMLVPSVAHRSLLLQTSSRQRLYDGADKIRDLIKHRRPGRALKEMEFLPNFEKELQEFIFKKVQKEAETVKLEKETSVADFSRENLSSFSYKTYHDKLLETTPLLTAALTGAVSNLPFSEIKNPHRKGFGGSRQDETISLKPVICQTASRLLHNKHPRSVSEIQCLNSVLNTIQHLPVKSVCLANGLGDCFSRKTSVKLVENLLEGHDSAVVEMRNKVEDIWKEAPSKRLRRTLSSQPGAKGFSFFADNVGKIVTPRHNVGLSNQNHYLQMTITLAAQNRISSSHMSDEPLLLPSDVNYFPTLVDIQRMSLWAKYWIAKKLVQYHSVFKACAKHIRPPEVKYSQKMAEKTSMSVLALDLEDPSSSEGMINVARKLVPYLPSLPNSKKQKTTCFGDQGFFERGYNSVWSLCSEKKAEDRLEGLLFLPQEWHKKREDLFIYNEMFNVSKQITQAGTLQNIKSSFNHSKASKDVSHFYASWDLMEVTTLINLLPVVETVTDMEVGGEAIPFTLDEFNSHVDNVFQYLDPFSKWAPAFPKDDSVSDNGAAVDEEEDDDTDEEEEEIDEVLIFHKDMLVRGVIQCSQKLSTQYGDCLALISFWKNSMADYHDSKKWKYRIAAFTKIAAAEGVFGEKIQTDSIYNCLINDQGLRDSNVDGDLKVEHVNKMFKAGLLDLAGNYNEDNLRRVALSMDLSKTLEDKLYPGYVDSEEPAFKVHLGHRNVDWSDQIEKGVQDMKEQKIFKKCPGRKVEGYKRTSEADLKALRKFIKKQSKEMKLYIQETF